jgi:hypothetical protein
MVSVEGKFVVEFQKAPKIDKEGSNTLIFYKR